MTPHIFYASPTKVKLSAPVHLGKPYRAECEECGWTRTYLTQETADWGADRHADATEHGDCWTFPNYLEAT